MIGKSLGHYKVIRSLGSGGMGEVWEAEDAQLGRRVALKMLPAEMAADEERLARFEQEARAVAALDHPGIVTIHSIEQVEGHRFITMQLVEGQTLGDLIEGSAGDELPLGRFFDIAIPLAEAVAAAHARGIAHRDLKPANVMITPEGRVLVLDFGLAKMLARGDDETATVANAGALTGEGKILGTVAYMSPEQAEGRKVDERSDIFSLGVILYELCTGKRPFEGDTQMSILTAIIRDTPASITELNRELPHHLGRIVRHCLEKDPARRMQSATDLRYELADLRRELDSGEVVESMSARPEPRSPARQASAAIEARQRRWLVPAAIAVALVLLGAWWMSRDGDETRLDATIGKLEALAAGDDLDALHEGLTAAGIDLSSTEAKTITDGKTAALTLEVTPASATATFRRVTPIDTFERHQDRVVPLSSDPVLLVAGEYLVTLQADGYQPASMTIELDAETASTVRRRLVADNAAAGMVYVSGGPSPLDPAVTVPGFFIDATEVTNAAYLQFVTEGGYRDDSLWPESVLVDGVTMPLDHARREFVDRTGIAGPREWSGGRYPEGYAGHPVTGISWYEAEAYARYLGKRLPDQHQWWRAAVGDGGRVFPWGNDVRTAKSRANFGLGGTVAAGSLPLGVSPFGCFDMAGNVREWLAATEELRRPVAGGSWQDPAYTFDPTFLEAFAPDYTRDSIGLRLVLPVEPEA